MMRGRSLLAAGIFLACEASRPPTTAPRDEPTKLERRVEPVRARADDDVCRWPGNGTPAVGFLQTRVAGWSAAPAEDPSPSGTPPLVTPAAEVQPDEGANAVQRTDEEWLEEAFGEAARSHARTGTELIKRRGIESSASNEVDCYRDLLQRQPDARGRVNLRFVLVPGPDGEPKTESVEVESREIRDPTFLACVEKQFGRRSHRGRKIEGPVTVTYPLVFGSPAEADAAGPEQWVERFPTGSGLLVYHEREGSLEVFLLRAGGRKVHGTSVGADWRAVATDARRALDVGLGYYATTDRGLQFVAEGSETRQSVQSPATTLDDVAAVLLPSQIAAALEDVRHLVIVPIGDLGSVPWSALEPPGLRGPLVERMSVTIAPSLGALGDRNPEWVPPRNSLVVGDPRPPEGLLLPRLPGARLEAGRAAERLGVEASFDAMATEASVRSRAGDADLIYVASHGIADPKDPIDGGFIMLASGDGHDGRWTAREIQNSRLNARLAVLSACQTGRGGTHAAGIMGVARGFQLAGVSRVVMSLWDVDDAGTYELMCRFVYHLEDTFPAEALRLAMLEQRRRGSKPAVWAAFAVFGAPG